MLKTLKCGSVLPSALLLWLVCTLACGKGSEQAEISKTGSAEPPAGISTADLDLDLTGLAPQLRDELEKIKVLIIRDENVADIWDLPNQSGGPDFIILACSGKLLSTDMLISLRKWASEGRGILVTRTALFSAWRHFSPKDLVAYSYGRGKVAVVEGSVITEHVSSVQNFLWCAAQTGGIKIQRAHQELNHDEILQALAIEQETFIPVVTQDYDDARGDNYLPLQLFVTTWKGARIAWLPSDLPEDLASGCELLVDDARLWSNLARWLAGK